MSTSNSDYKKILLEAIESYPHLINLNDHRDKLSTDELEEVSRILFIAKLKTERLHTLANEGYYYAQYIPKKYHHQIYTKR